VNGPDSVSRIRTAAESIRRGRFGEASAFLEGIRAAESSDPSLVFLSAYSSIMSGNLPSALAATERLRLRFSEYKPGRELNAFILLKSAPERDHAAAVYIDLISSGIDSPNVKRLLKRIRSERDFVSFQKSLTLDDALPIEKIRFTEKSRGTEMKISAPVRSCRRPRRIPFKPVILSVIALSLAVFLVYLLAFTAIPYRIFKKNTPENTPVDSADISNERYPLVDRNAKNPMFTYADEDSLRRDYENARNLIKAGSSEPALVILNRIMNSNAQYMLKDRARFLSEFIAGMEDRSPKDISPAELIGNPVLYKGMFVRFSSSVVSVKTKESTTVVSTVYQEKGSPSVNADIFTIERMPLKPGDRITCAGIFRQIAGAEKRMLVESKSISRQ
jgi:hypothetical protein